ncbi:MAG: UDP-N-acetylglucosamine 2-epimerase (non-hydrolyzing) [Bacteroidetes bacterium]|nr:UDP-N-acetylglucosamine 2-epimerase (non-hydrolyzing) [Bacteroidota bacterium]
MRISIIAGARPNFMKIAPIIRAIANAQKNGDNINYRLIHTGQHYDHKMSATFFEELNIPSPDVNLECGGGTQAEQTAAILIAFEKELLENPADLVLVVGDVTSTMACAIVAKKLNTKVAHVEAGIRSFDLTMPEEINRMVTDSITDYFFTTSNHANSNLKNVGISKDRIFHVGNVMIDTLLVNLDRLKKPSFFDELSLQNGKYFVMTMHRPANVDEQQKLKEFISQITSNVQGLPIVFPMHPRTKKIFDNLKIVANNLHIVAPLGYLEFNYLVKNSFAVITDSGGITEETTVLGIPCMTLRDNTERPETIEEGTNELVGTNPQAIKAYLEKLFAGEWKKGTIPNLWDGRAAERIVKSILNLL